MKVLLLAMSLLLPLLLSAQSPAWADEEKSGSDSHVLEMEWQRQNATEELASILRETLALLRNLNGKPTADDNKHLDAMMVRLNVLIAEQKEMMEHMEKEQKENVQRQNETFSPPPRQEEILPPR